MDPYTRSRAEYYQDHMQYSEETAERWRTVQSCKRSKHANPNDAPETGIVLRFWRNILGLRFIPRFNRPVVRTSWRPTRELDKIQPDSAEI